jgi:ADP-ribosylglycohydrolase
MKYADYLDRVHAGWLGKSLGGVVGAPYENHKIWHGVGEERLWPKELAANDDLDIQVVWLEAMQARGVFLTHQDLVDFWQDRCRYNFCEYGHFLHNAQRGILPPLSGSWNNEFFRESEGCPIRSEIWGFVCPGNPALAAELAQLDAELDHAGASVRIERFLAAAAAQALVVDSLDEALSAGLGVIPSDCPEARAVEKVRRICEETPIPWQAWQRLIRAYGDRDASKAMTNHAIVLMALFLGEGDFVKTIHLCVNAGWDVDCTAATAGALLGALKGTKCLPGDWCDRLGPNLVCGIEVDHKTAPIDSFSDETCRLGVEMAALRSPAVVIEDAPEVKIRSAPAACPRITVRYPGDPVLRCEGVTRVELTVENPTEEKVEGELTVSPAANTQADFQKAWLAASAGSSETVMVEISRVDPGLPLHDTNLFTAHLAHEGGVLEQVFGLGGANLWLAYGPYWDMWDRKKNEVCPYFNEETICLPGQVTGCGGDNYNHYVELDHAYLDEERLLVEDIPDEVPVAIGAGEDVIDEEELGGFYGAACYYLVRTIQAPEPMPATGIFFGRSCPVKVWLDGELIYERDSMRCWSIRDECISVDLTGEPQRFVVKLARQTETGSFSMNFIRPNAYQEKRRGISYLADCIVDLPPSIAGVAPVER